MVSLTPFLAVLFLVGTVAGRAAALWSCWCLDGVRNTGLIRCTGCGTRIRRRQQLVGAILPGKCRICGSRDVTWPVITMILTGLLFAGFGWLLVFQGCQTVTEVRPAGPLWQGRLPFHLMFLFLMLTATLTDLLDYTIPDAVVGLGTVIAIVGATASGELQMIHIWVSWDDTMVSLYGPYLPDWMKQHQHLHGLAWSVAGSAAGAGLTGIVRVTAGGILGYPAVGLGDVTLMAMIGAFMGWQPVLCVLAIAPVGGIAIGTLIRVITGRSFVAFGPYLTFAAVVVLCCWNLLWERMELRNIFGHGPTIAGMTTAALGVLCLVLTGLRIFRTLPTDVMKR